MQRRERKIVNSFSNSEGIDLGFGYGPEPSPYQRPNVQILTPRTDDNDSKPAPEKIVQCPNCGNGSRMIFTTAGFFFHKQCLTTLKLDFDALPGTSEQIVLDSNSEPVKPAFISVKRRSPFTEGQDKEEGFEVSGSLRKAHIRTNDLGSVTEDRIRKYFQGEASYY